MSGLLQQKPQVEADVEEPLVVDLGDEASADVLEALSANMARAILSALYAEPKVQSDLADHLDTSIQNIDHHVRNLVDAGLITVVGQWQSEKGRPMDVYGPANESLVMVFGNDNAGNVRPQAVETGKPDRPPQPTD